MKDHMNSNVEKKSSQPTASSDSRMAARKRSTKNLLLRGFSAIAVLALFYYCLWWDTVNASAWGWTLFVSALSLLCLREFYRLARACEIQPFAGLGYVGGIGWLLATEWDLSGGSAVALGMDAAWLVFVLAGTGALLLPLTRKTNDNALIDVSATLFGIVYCSMLPGLCIHMRHMRLDAGGWPMHGVEFVVVCVFVSKVSDVGALLTGSRWGKHKLIPRLSPGKTWEGAIGGLLFSVFLLLFMAWMEPRMALAGLGWGKLVLLAFLLAAGGLAGDLVESSFKRNSRQKDAGAGVPGFGGVLDLTDSLMVASPVMYFFLVACGAEYVRQF